MTPQASAARAVGRYWIHRQIGGGGMATVHLGRLAGPVGFGRTVAIKCMHRDYARDPEFVAMFVDEARLAARIQHPNVVQTLDVIADNGDLYLVMDLVHGVPLTRLMRAGPVPVRIATAIACGLLLGLHAAHEATDENGNALELVHRDVSPHNVLVGADGVARVLDFGIAKATGRRSSTRDGTIKGKYAYMAPEQITNVLVTRQCDVFAASIVVWEALTGQRLFRAETERDTLARVMASPIDPPSRHASGISGELDNIVLKGLERDQRRRYATARDMARDLEQLPMATQSEVGEWVAQVAGDDLAARAEQVTAIERSSPSLPDAQEASSGVRPSVITVREGPAADEGTQVSTSSDARGLPKPGSLKRTLALVAVVVACAVGLVTWRLRVGHEPQQAAPVPPPPSTTTSQIPAPPPPTVFELVDVPAAAKPSSTSLPAAPPATPRATVSAKPAASPAPTVDCTSPSYIGPDNRVHYKLECLKP